MPHRNEKAWKQVYVARGAYWEHSGDSCMPHALLTSGKHSNGFFNSRLITADDQLLEEAVGDLCKLFAEDFDGAYHLNNIHRVVGPQSGATKLAEFLALQISSRRGWACEWASPKKHGDGSHRIMVFDGNDTGKVTSEELVLLCEDVITTGDSVRQTARAVEEEQGTLAPFVFCLVNRSGLEEIDGHLVVALVSSHLPIWEPEDCPLCKVGSEPVRPKDNWNKLSGA